MRLVVAQGRSILVLVLGERDTCAEAGVSHVHRQTHQSARAGCSASSASTRADPRLKTGARAGAQQEVSNMAARLRAPSQHNCTCRPLPPPAPQEMLPRRGSSGRCCGQPRLRILREVDVAGAHGHPGLQHNVAADRGHRQRRQWSDRRRSAPPSAPLRPHLRCGHAAVRRRAARQARWLPRLSTGRQLLRRCVRPRVRARIRSSSPRARARCGHDTKLLLWAQITRHPKPWSPTLLRGGAGSEGSAFGRLAAAVAALEGLLQALRSSCEAVVVFAFARS